VEAKRIPRCRNIKAHAEKEGGRQLELRLSIIRVRFITSKERTSSGHAGSAAWGRFCRKSPLRRRDSILRAADALNAVRHGGPHRLEQNLRRPSSSRGERILRRNLPAASFYEDFALAALSTFSTESAISRRLPLLAVPLNASVQLSENATPMSRRAAPRARAARIAPWPECRCDEARAEGWYQYSPYAVAPVGDLVRLRVDEQRLADIEPSSEMSSLCDLMDSVRSSGDSSLGKRRLRTGDRCVGKFGLSMPWYSLCSQRAIAMLSE